MQGNSPEMIPLELVVEELDLLRRLGVVRIGHQLPFGDPQQPVAELALRVEEDAVVGAVGLGQFAVEQ